MEVKFHGGPNQTSVEKGGDELWIGEKFQSNPEIAGSPRVLLEIALGLASWIIDGGRALNGRGGLKSYQTLSNSEYHTMQTMGVSPREISSAGKRGTPQINR